MDNPDPLMKPKLELLPPDLVEGLWRPSPLPTET